MDWRSFGGRKDKTEVWAWKRDGMHATITCGGLQGGATYALVCEKGQWVGKFAGCAAEKESNEAGLWFMCVLFSVCICVFVCLCVILCVCVFFVCL